MTVIVFMYLYDTKYKFFGHLYVTLCVIFNIFLYKLKIINFTKNDTGNILYFP